MDALAKVHTCIYTLYLDTYSNTSKTTKRTPRSGRVCVLIDLRLFRLAFKQLQLQYFIISSQYIYETLTISNITDKKERKKEHLRSKIIT